MEVGTFGKRLLKLLWMPITTYLNHWVADYLCWKYCNPSPGDGSAPNLVVMAYDKNGRPYLKWAFNTQIFIYQLFQLNPAEYNKYSRFVNNLMHGLVDISQFSNVWHQENLTGFYTPCYSIIQSMSSASSRWGNWGGKLGFGWRSSRWWG